MSVRVVHSVVVRDARTTVSTEAALAAQPAGGVVVDHRGSVLPVVVHHPAPPDAEVAWVTVLADGAPEATGTPLTWARR